MLVRHQTVPNAGSEVTILRRIQHLNIHVVPLRMQLRLDVTISS